MALEHELSTLPEHAITILKFMSRQGTGQTETSIQTGTGLSDRSLGKALKRLVTRRFLSMNASTRVYQLTGKGTQAIEILASGNIRGVQDNSSQPSGILYDLCAVVPLQLPADQPSEWQLGVHPAGTDSPPQPTDLFLRITTDDAEVVPDEIILPVSAEQTINSMPMMITPNSGKTQIRLHIEAFQLFEIEEPALAGGMYFDVQVGSDTGSVRAIHIPISII
jgi:predicted transcriptional regulator